MNVCVECGFPLFSTDNGVRLVCLNPSCELLGQPRIDYDAWGDIYIGDPEWDDIDAYEWSGGI